MADKFLLAVQLGMGVVFLLSAAGKLLNPVGFARGVKQYRVLPTSVALHVGLLLIALEVFLAVSHLSGWLLAIAVPLGLAMLASFLVAVTVNLKRGRVLPCYCFGSQSRETISTTTLTRLLLLFLAELFVLADLALSGTGKLTYPGRIATLAELGLILFWATFLLVGGLWLLSVTDLVALLRPCLTCSANVATANSRREPSPARETSN